MNRKPPESQILFDKNSSPCALFAKTLILAYTNSSTVRVINHRELKLDGAIGHFAEPL